MKKKLFFLSCLSMLLFSCGILEAIFVGQQNFSRLDTEPLYFNSIKLNSLNSTETVILMKEKYAVGVYDFGFEIIEENLPVDFKYNGKLTLFLYDKNNILLQKYEIEAIDKMLYSDSTDFCKACIFWTGSFDIEDEYIKFAIKVNDADPQFSKYNIRLFLCSTLTP